jgi:hypothetical protein
VGYLDNNGELRKNLIMDAILSRVIAGLAGHVAKPIVEPAARAATKRILGPAQRREMNQISLAAVKSAVEMTMSDLPYVDRVHIVGLLEKLLAEYGNTESLIHDLHMPSHDWPILELRSLAVRAGLDLETLPVNFEEIATALLDSIRSQVAARIREPGSVLFPSVILAQLDQLSADMHALRLSQNDRIMAHNLRLEPVFERRINAVFVRSRMRNRAFQTPDLLLALLDEQASTAARCFEQVEAGLAYQISRMLRDYVETQRPVVDFEEGSVYDRADIQFGQQLAFIHGLDAVDDSRVFLGILRSESSTRAQLVEFLEHRFLLLTNFAYQALQFNARRATPGVIFPPRQYHLSGSEGQREHE